jgi:hypothetical protein
MRFTVSPGGDIHVAPVKFGARKGDYLLWAVTNASNGPIKVAITDFQRKDHIFKDKGETPITPVDFFAGIFSVDLAHGETKIIGGEVNTDPVSGFPFFIDGVSYTIEVRSLASPSAFPDVDYDPDGEIKP